MKFPIANGLTFDIEEWFHILNLPTSPPFSMWDTLENTVEPNTYRLLEILDESGTKATFFVLGWIAKRYPALVRAIHAAGHEVGSHGSMHDLVYKQGRERFREDLARARGELEDLIGSVVIGYRAPGFSITEKTPWAFDEIRRAGFLYDSSVFPASRNHGGFRGALVYPHEISLPSGQRLIEFPISVLKFNRFRIPFSGGGYLRLFPYLILRYGIQTINRLEQPACIYLHPREIDPTHPRVAMSKVRAFQSYVNLRTTEPKLRSLLAEFSCVPVMSVLKDIGLLKDAAVHASISHID